MFGGLLGKDKVQEAIQEKISYVQEDINQWLTSQSMNFNKEIKGVTSIKGFLRQ
jgi:hypothetical protein